MGGDIFGQSAAHTGGELNNSENDTNLDDHQKISNGTLQQVGKKHSGGSQFSVILPLSTAAMHRARTTASQPDLHLQTLTLGLVDAGTQQPVQEKQG